GRRRRARPARRLRRPAPRARRRAPVVLYLHVGRGAADRRLAGARRRFRAPGAGSLPGHPARERRDQPARGASARPGRSPGGPPRPRRALDRARDRRGLRRPARRPGGDHQHRLQHRGARSEPRGHGARGEPAAPAPRRGRRRRRDGRRLRAPAAARRDHDAGLRRGGRRSRGGAPRRARRARVSAPRAFVHAVLPVRGLSAGRAAHAARRVGRQAEPAAPAVAAVVAVVSPRRQRRLALGVLLGACALAALAFPLRSRWWGGLILAIAEAGIVGGLADWFAVTALFRRPLGLPIPHTALIPANWELMAERVGAMVGGRVLTPSYVVQEIERVDVADLLARGAERVSQADLETATRAVASWAAEQLTAGTASELVARLRALLTAQPVAPTLAAALRIARDNGWDGRVVQAVVLGLADALERPDVRATVAEVIDELLTRYRAGMGVYPRLWIGLAELLGVL